MPDENARLRLLLAEAMYPAIVMLLALKRQGLGSKAHAKAIKTYEVIMKEIARCRSA